MKRILSRYDYNYKKKKEKVWVFNNMQRENIKNTKEHFQMKNERKTKFKNRTNSY